MKECDVVVVGSGMGGMSCAALLTDAGYRTLVVEKLPRVGGRCSSFEYRGFHLTTGALSLPGQGSIVEQVFGSVGAEFDLRPHPKVVYRVGGKDLQLPEKGALRALVAAAAQDNEDADAVMNAFRKAWTWQEPPANMSLRDWLLEYTQDQGILGVFQAIVGSQHGVRINELPAAEFISFVRVAATIENYGFAPRGNLAFMESLARAIRDKGAEVWTRSPVSRIKVADGMVCGVVVTRDGEDIDIAAKAVVSNAGPRKTVELAGEQNFDKGYIRELREKIRPAPFVWLAISASESLIGDLTCLMLTESRRVNSIWCPTIICPDLAPRGKHLLYAGCNPATSLPPMNRRQDIELSIQDLRDNLPGFDQKAEVLMASYFCGGWPVYHTWPGYDMTTKTSLPNLYNVGDGAKASGWLGLPACAQTARTVVEDIRGAMRAG